jgi:hypothetical protein
MRVTPEQASRELLRIVPALQEEAERSMRDAVEVGFQRMAELMPHGATGEMERDIQHTVRKTPDGFIGTVRPRSPHARFVEEGTGGGKTIRNRHGSAYSAETGLAVTAGEEAAGAFGVLTASGWASRTAGKPMALHIGGRVIFRSRVRGQRARHFIERTRELTHTEVMELLAGGAERATRRLLR